MVRCNFTPHAIRSWRARSQTAHEFMGPLQIMEKIHRDFTERPKARRRPGETTHVTVSGGAGRGGPNCYRVSSTLSTTPSPSVDLFRAVRTPSYSLYIHPTAMKSNLGCRVVSHQRHVQKPGSRPVSCPSGCLSHTTPTHIDRSQMRAWMRWGRRWRWLGVCTAEFQGALDAARDRVSQRRGEVGLVHFHAGRSLGRGRQGARLRVAAGV
jgi:hypothetical protein